MCIRDSSWIGFPPAPGAADSSPASSTARSYPSTSMIIQPAMRSLVSGNGPSVTGGRPSPSYRTHAPSGARAWPSTNSPDFSSRSAKSCMYRMWAEISSGVHRSMGTSLTGAGAPR